MVGNKEKYFLKDIKGSLEEAYNNNIGYLDEIDNEYYNLFEITFYCLYLSILEIYNNNKNKKNQNEDIQKIFNSIYKFIISYEKYSLYINFIDDEGYKTYIKNKYHELYNYLSNDNDLFENDYKTTSELRKHLLNNMKFKIYDYYGERYIDIIKKDVKFMKNEEIGKKYGSLNENEIMLLYNSINEDKGFYKGEKAKEAKKFYEKFDYDKKDEFQRNKYFNSYIDNYLSIFEN